MVLVKKKYNVSLSVSNNFRQIFFDKLNLSNIYLGQLKAVGLIYLDLKALDDFDSSRLFSAAFVLKLLTGVKPHVVKFALFQTFREKSYDLRVQVTVRHKALESFMCLLSYEVLPFLSKADCFVRALKEKNGILVTFTISDLSFFRVVETHSAFFKWHDKVRMHLYFSIADFVHLCSYLSALKIDLEELVGYKIRDLLRH